MGLLVFLYRMTKLLPFSTKLPETIQSKISQIATLLGYSQNQVVIEILEMGFNIIYSPDYGGFPRIVTAARALLLEERTQQASKAKFPFDKIAIPFFLADLPAPVKNRLRRASLNGGQMRAIRHLAVVERITRREYEAVAQTPASTAKRQLARLVKFGVLVRRGKSRNSWYEFDQEEKTPIRPKIMNRK